MQAPARRPARRNSRARILLRRALLALVLLAGWRCADAEAASLSPLLRDLARGAGEYRPIGPRLTISRGYAPCRETPPPPDGTVTGAACPAVPANAASSRPIRRVTRAAKEAGVEPAALHATALIDLLWGGSGSALDRGIQTLHTAARLSDDRAPLLADLAAAYLLRAERMQTPGDLDRALEAAEEAVELDSASLAALYNRGLALERIGLAEAADEAWTAYLRADDEPGWADEARAWLRHTVTMDVAPPANPTPASAAEFARRAPQQANTWGWEVLLPAWAAAHQSGNAAAADSALRLAESVGAALVTARRDATLADAVAAIRAADPMTVVRLARAHRTYAEARRLYEAGDRPTAEPLFARAGADASGSPALQSWARLFRGATLAYVDPKNPTGEAAARAVVVQADSTRYPALAGRARWIVGLIVARRGRYEEGRSWLLRAELLLEHAGEDEHRGSVEYLAADIQHRLGSAEAADQERHRAMLRLEAFPRSVWRHNLLMGAGDRAAGAGLPRAALHYHADDVRGTTGGRLPLYEVEARLARARLLASLDQQHLALADVRAALPLLGSLDAEFAQEWSRHDLLFADAEIQRHTNPARAAAALSDVITYFESQSRLEKLLPALLTRADAVLATGDGAAAQSDLRAAADLILKLGVSVQGIPQRATLFQQARHIFDRLALSLVAAGRNREALEHLEQARVTFSLFPRPSPPELQVAEGEVGVEYAFIGDTLLIWTVLVDSVEMVRRTVDRAAILRMVERVSSSLELRRVDQETHRELGELYDLLIGPVDARKGTEQRLLTIVADGALAAVPFASLYNRRSRHYLVQDRAISLVNALSAPTRTRKSRGKLTRVLLVANPAFNAQANPGYSPLPGAADEVTAIASLYSAPQRLVGRDADRAQLVSAAQQAELIHFAGHAVLDDVRPERSYLLLAGAPEESRMTAEDVLAMDLRGVRLVVLSACQTARGPGSRSSGFTGLSAAMGAAGAEGVLGSLWRVDDHLTRPLMIEFHRAYLVSGNAPEALRAAQLSLLHSPDRHLRSPAAWAGFSFVVG